MKSFLMIGFLWSAFSLIIVIDWEGDYPPLDCGCQSGCIIVLASWHCLLSTVDIYIVSYWIVGELKMSRFLQIEHIFWSAWVLPWDYPKLCAIAFVPFLLSFTFNYFRVAFLWATILSPHPPKLMFCILVSVIRKHLYKDGLDLGWDPQIHSSGLVVHMTCTS